MQGKQVKIPDIMIIMGPTGSGKSSLALLIARLFGGEIVNADARQIYRGAVIGTASPGATDIQKFSVPHHLYNFLAPTCRFSAGAYIRRARRIILHIASQGHLPIIVGGTGLYIRALRFGLASTPHDPEILRRLTTQYLSQGSIAAWEDLRQRDPLSASRIHPHDWKRCLRALEIIELTHKPASELWARHRWATRKYREIVVGLCPPRAILAERIRVRTRMMWSKGWVDEVRALLDQKISIQAPVFESIGYRAIASYLEKSATAPIEPLIQRIQHTTLEYARKQLKWLRREPGVLWFSQPPPLAWIQHRIWKFNHPS